MFGPIQQQDYSRKLALTKLSTQQTVEGEITQVVKVDKNTLILITQSSNTHCLLS